MRHLFTLFCLFAFCFAHGQEDTYDGIYSYGTTPDSGRVGVVYVYQNSDSTLLFYLELNRGAPSYNSGAIRGQMNIYSPGEADYTLIAEDDYFNCSMNFWFVNDSLYIRTNDQADDCGYGYGVHSSGDFKKIESKRPESFADREGNEYLFESWDWKRWKE